MIWMNNNIQSTASRRFEFLGSHTGEAHLFPDLWDISFLCGFKGEAILLKHNVDNGKLLVVSSLLEKDSGSSV